MLQHAPWKSCQGSQWNAYWCIMKNIRKHRKARQKCWLEWGCGKLHRSSRTALGTLFSNNNHIINYIETFSATQYFHGNLIVHSNQWSWVTKSIFNPLKSWTFNHSSVFIGVLQAHGRDFSDNLFHWQSILKV